ncbi:MAG: glutathione S-transferase family protein [Verrucomicrobiales bacterium]|nr:glutathione S-transferase family protein [Verrucomicrobiales bacterium]
MSLTLYELTHSPFCISVTRFLDAYGIEYRSIEIPAWDRRELARITGGEYYQVPVLDHAGKIIHETSSDPLAVAHYLDQNFAEGRLFPDHCSGLQEIVISHIEDTLEGIGFRLSDPGYVDSIEDLGERIMLIRHKERKLGPGCVEEWRKNASRIGADFEAALAPYESRLAQSSFLFGDKPVYADFALYGVLGNAEYGGQYQLSDSFKNLKNWQTELRNFNV